MERAKHALTEQLSLRGEASCRAQQLRDEQPLVRRAPGSLCRDDASGNDGEQEERAVEIAELELRIAASSRVGGSCAPVEAGADDDGKRGEVLVFLSVEFPTICPSRRSPGGSVYVDKLILCSSDGKLCLKVVRGSTRSRSLVFFFRPVQENTRYCFSHCQCAGCTSFVCLFFVGICSCL